MLIIKKNIMQISIQKRAKKLALIRTIFKLIIVVDIKTLFVINNF